MKLFKKKSTTKSYDKENTKPVIKASICNGEQVAGFKDLHTGKIEEVMLIKSPADLERLAQMYIRKQNIFTERKIYPYAKIDDLRLDLLSKIRIMAQNHAGGNHPCMRTIGA